MHHIDIFKALSEQDIQLVTGYFVHAADLAGPAKAFDLAYLWAVRVNTEFTNQVSFFKSC